jgi:hypothetical protein
MRRPTFTSIDFGFAIERRQKNASGPATSTG